MNIIKFRAWYKRDLEINEYIEFKTVYSDGTVRFEWNDNEFKHPLTYDLGLVFAGSDWVVEQYTGIKDKNGKEIYVGDIVKYTHDWEVYPVIDLIAEVTFGDGGFYPIQEANGGIYYGLDSEPIYEVIGNIHENKYLL